MQNNMGTTEAGGRTTRNDGEFAWRVLDQMPSALLVVDEHGQVTYGNAALVRLVGHDPDDVTGVSVFDYVHPDDATWLAEAYLEFVADGAAEAKSNARPSIHVRIITAEGETVPLEITGARSITDEVIGGIIYDVRPARYHDVLGHVLAGLTAGDDVADLLGLVAQLIALPPLDLEAVVLERSDDNAWHVVSSTSDELARALGDGHQLPLHHPATEPVRFADEDIGAARLASLRSLGFVDIWRVSVGTDGYEIVASSRRHQGRSTSVTERLVSARELAGVVSMQAKSEGRLRQAAEEDSLTGVYNRATFRRHLAAAIDCAPHQRSAVLFLDLDDFKPVNDQFGHAAGDAVLQVVTQRLRAVVRPDDLVARLGGDEFGVLLVADDSIAGLSAVARRIVDALTTPISLGPIVGGDLSDQRVSVSVSVGAAYVTGGETVDQVLGRADRLMYEAKRAGGGQLRIDTLPN